MPIVVLASFTLMTSGSIAADSCDTCRLTLTARTGPYAVVARKDLADAAARRASMWVTIANTSGMPLVLGDARPASRVTLNFVTPRVRGREVIAAVPAGHTKRIPPGSRFTFRVASPLRMGRPGAYRFNVSYGAVDSNIVTYTVR